MPIQIKKTILPLELGDKKNYSMDNEYGITLISLDENIGKNGAVCSALSAKNRCFKSVA